MRNPFRLITLMIGLVVLLTLLELGATEAEAGRAKAGRSQSRHPRLRLKKSVVPAKALRGRKQVRARLHRESRQPSPELSSQVRPGARRARKPTPSRAIGARLERMRSKPAASSRAKSRLGLAKAKVGARIGKASRALKTAWARLKNHPRTVHLTERWRQGTNAVTRQLDVWQARAPPRVARSLKFLRTYSLPSVGGFLLSLIDSDRKFLGSLFAVNGAATYVALPGAIALGMDPVVSGLLNLLTTPVLITAVILRDRHLKKENGEDASIESSARALLGQYRDFAQQRRTQTSVEAQAAANAANAH